MDQAAELRELMRHDAAHLRAAGDDAPHVVAVASGKGGVGTTTVAVNLATALVRQGRRVVLVDANLDGANLIGHCQLEPDYSIADVLCGSRSIHEVLCRAPAGMHVLPGAWMPDAPVDCTPKSQERLIASLRSLGAHADDIVLDVGCGVGRVNRRFWHAADKVLVIATPDDAAIMNVYAAIKLICGDDPELPVFSLVNFVPDAATGRSVHERLELACQRFLGRHLFAGGYLPAATEVRDALRLRQPFVLAAPACEAAVQIERAAQQLIAPRGEPPAPRMLDRLLRRQSKTLVAERSVAQRG